MTYGVEVRTVAEEPIAVVAGTTRFAELPATIQRLFDEYYEHAPGDGDGVERGCNVVVYRGTTADGALSVECGTQVTGDFSGSGPVTAARLPAGSVATTVHLGEYTDLHLAHQAIVDWCAANGRAKAGVEWEVYGDWSDDPAERRTDVFYLLA